MLPGQLLRTTNSRTCTSNLKHITLGIPCNAALLHLTSGALLYIYMSQIEAAYARRTQLLVPGPIPHQHFNSSSALLLAAPDCCWPKPSPQGDLSAQCRASPVVFATA